MNLVENIDTVSLAKKNQANHTTTPQAEKNQTTTKYTAIKTKTILTNTVPPTTTPKKSYIGNGIEQNTTPI